MEIINRPTPEEKNMALFCHLAGLIPFVAFANIIVPLIIWLIKKDESEYINKHGKEVLNFQISMSIYFFVAGLLFLIVIGVFVMPALVVLYYVFTIIGSVKAGNGELYNYPLSIKFIQ